MTMELRVKKVGPYTVKELPMRETMAVLKKVKESETPDEDRGPALLGASVFNGTGEPLGLAVLDLGSGLYQLLLAAHGEVNAPPSFGEPQEATEGNG